MPPAAAPELILASASPRRQELLGWLGVPFRVVVSAFDEASLGHLTDPVEYVTRAAREKAEEVARRCDGVILGVDTDVVAPDGRILGKPADDEDARRMLRALSGRTHHVFTSICLLRSKAGRLENHRTRLSSADVTFRRLSDASIDYYLRHGEHRDKAGAYGIQGRALAFVERIDGDLSCVIGLPLSPLTEMLEELGVSLWNTGGLPSY